MHALGVIVPGILALGILVFVHELGHFLVAKAAGIRVLKFSLGFGSRVVGFKLGETEYLISALPLGGYVKMAGEQLEEGQPIRPGDYFYRPWWMRLLVLVAGPCMNLVAAVLVLGTLFWAGFKVPLAQPQIVQVTAGSPAAAAGLQPGDVVNRLGNEAVNDWEVFAERLNAAAGQDGRPLTLGFSRQGREQSAVVKPSRDAATGHWLIGVGLMPASTSVIDRVFVGTPAEVAGFKAGDRVLSVEGHPVWTKYDFQIWLWPRAGQSTRVRVQRGKRELEMAVTPMAQQMPQQGKVGVIGVNFKASDLQRRIQYPFGKAYALGAAQTGSMSRSIIASLGQMLSGQISAKDSVGGPITIIRMAGQEAGSGIQDFFFFLAGISIMLAILNLLPIPVLDGGNAVFFIIEGIIGKPVPTRWQDMAQRVGFALLVALMIFATYNDISKLVATALGGGAGR